MNEKEIANMQKSVYSLVLSDDVVAQIDKLAYTMNTNRSNMINQILAEYVSYVTPEKRMHDIFKRMEDMLTGRDTFQVLMQPSDTMFSLRSALAYKYNPTVKYSVELYRTESDCIGELRVSLRTQNSSLILYMMQFCKLWVQLEESAIGPVEYAIGDGKFARKLRLRRSAEQKEQDGSVTPDVLGEWIAGYVSVFDEALKTYFYHLTEPEVAVRKIRTLYRQYLNNCHSIL